MEGILARGDRRLNGVILDGYKKGCFYDAWDDQFKYDVWMETLHEHGLTWETFARSYDSDEVLPWDFIDVGVTKNFYQVFGTNPFYWLTPVKNDETLNEGFLIGDIDDITIKNGFWICLNGEYYLSSEVMTQSYLFVQRQTVTRERLVMFCI